MKTQFTNRLLYSALPLRSICLIVIFACCLNISKAQSVSFAYANGTYSKPVDGTSIEKYSYGLGVDGGVGIGANSTFFVASAGYSSFIAKSSNSKTPSYNMDYVPIKVGVRQYLPGDVFFLNANAGMGIITNKSQNPQILSSALPTADFGAGIRISSNFEISGNYDVMKEPVANGFRGWLVLKAGWIFDFN